MSGINHKETVLFLCKNNSGRSQMAEALLEHLYREYYDVYSAGTDPSTVNPLTVEVMGEIGVDISENESKSLEKYQEMEFDYVVTLCGSLKESCPVFVGAKQHIHHGFSDPREFKGTKTDKLACFRMIRDEIKEWIEKEFNKGTNNKGDK